MINPFVPKYACHGHPHTRRQSSHRQRLRAITRGVLWLVVPLFAAYTRSDVSRRCRCDQAGESGHLRISLVEPFGTAGFSAGIPSMRHRPPDSRRKTDRCPVQTRFGERTPGYAPYATRKTSSPYRFSRTNYSPWFDNHLRFPTSKLLSSRPGGANVRP